MPATQSVTAPPDRKPRDDEIDIYGLTHPGRVRKDNQDHFLVCALHKSATVQHSSLPLEHLTPGSQRVALLMMVADGVGGGHRRVAEVVVADEVCGWRSSAAFSSPV